MEKCVSRFKASLAIALVIGLMCALPTWAETQSVFSKEVDGPYTISDGKVQGSSSAWKKNRRKVSVTFT